MKRMKVLIISPLKVVIVIPINTLQMRRVMKRVRRKVKRKMKKMMKRKMKKMKSKIMSKIVTKNLRLINLNKNETKNV